jgi:hypothetical protein
MAEDEQLRTCAQSVGRPGNAEMIAAMALLAGCLIAVVGYSLTAVAASGGGDGGLLLPIALFVAGFGQGMAASPILTVALSKVAPQDAADASGVLTTVIQLGLVLGVATFGTVFLNQAALPGSQPTVGAITFTLALIVIALVGCAVASTAMVRAQRSASVAFGDAIQEMGDTTSVIGIVE